MTKEKTLINVDYLVQGFDFWRSAVGKDNVAEVPLPRVNTRFDDKSTKKLDCFIIKRSSFEVQSQWTWSVKLTPELPECFAMPPPDCFASPRPSCNVPPDYWKNQYLNQRFRTRKPRTLFPSKCGPRCDLCLRPLIKIEMRLEKNDLQTLRSASLTLKLQNVWRH